ncbi:serine/threonine-protein phosphatase [Micromonospora orduensis]|uniref:Serine/threonine-protein phosphatase n=1 Tax=Micromonospora orduensis TaxID=1420891 RepID=A0A5C4QQ11_9ACTN|nr:protein phosphatase 2C domain-containing protein [Micromonospora orduensis]TNH28814.1 serine/threonine-protein phosphatase [Micromonospora orduensis]
MGLVRRRNEDAIHVGPFLIAIADGLGGHVAGDVASSTAIEAVRRYDQVVTPDALSVALGQAVDAANKALRQRTEAEPDLAGMGTTLVAMLKSGETVALANVGDSRAYLLRGTDPLHGQTTQITEDHLYKHLVADAADVPNLPDRLARFLDGRPDGRSPDITLLTLAPGDRILLCTDGLSSYVPHDQVHTTLANSVTPQEAVERLIASALAHGGPDNVTVAVIYVASRSNGQRKQLER